MKVRRPQRRRVHQKYIRHPAEGMDLQRSLQIGQGVTVRAIIEEGMGDSDEGEGVVEEIAGEATVGFYIGN